MDMIHVCMNLIGICKAPICVLLVLSLFDNVDTVDCKFNIFGKENPSLQSNWLTSPSCI